MEAEACTERGALGALLRREGLYSSQLVKWRAQAKRAHLAALGPKKRGPVAKPVDTRDAKLAELQREIERLRRRAERAEALVEAQKKLSQLLGILLPTCDERA